ncbi:cytochrome c maturation protein CcmE [Sphingomonas sabuli]|uniref:Cytochrome c-type biogenesis protein CcmE n=1 Tax=Sphingomonas sabuli TaxID=2764186 RepID=A0A7G9L3R1_9SPHN|nr:cytochrome c maturation protein CcmE [Sphingomonas sabuli]QNM83260.1 cytochrome c maturation protein CcmE [Sphingomonas sabuli]
MIAKPKHQRLALVVAAIVAVTAAVLLAMVGLQNRAAYFYTPAEIAAGRAEAGTPIRLGGMVEQGSVKKLPDGVTTQFRLHDADGSVPVSFRGILPDLFREGSGAVAEGQMRADGTFVADEILAKHDERYMPPELGNQAAEHKAATTVEQ